MFKNPFFSISGQAERLKNVSEVLKIAINPFSKDKISANIKNEPIKKAVEFVANKPYITAGAATLAGFIPKIATATTGAIAGATAKVGTGAIAGATTGKLLTTAGLLGTGAIAGGILGATLRGGTSPIKQTQQPQQNTPIDQKTTTDQSQVNWQYTDQSQHNTIRGSPGATAGGSQYAGMTPNQYALPYQQAQPQFSADLGQEATQKTQDFLIPILIGLGAYIFLKK